jgi:formylglycine-generating enzyme required for sulfatase activity
MTEREQPSLGGKNPNSTPDRPPRESERLIPQTFQPLGQNTDESRRGLPLRTIGLALAGLLALSALAFLFAARSLEVVIHTESEATLEITGVTIPLGDRYLILSGTHDVHVTAEGYEPYHGTIAVTDEQTQRVDIFPAILPGWVSIDTQPTGAQVWLDDTLLGAAPIARVSMTAGSHSLRISAPRYQALERDLQVTGRGVVQQIALALEPDWALVHFQTDPTAVTISVDGNPEVYDNGAVEVLSGEHLIDIAAPGYQAHQVQVTIEAGVDQDLGVITLRPADGLLELDSEPSMANVSVDGRFQGRTPLTLSLTPGLTHRIQISKAGYQRRTERVSLERGTQDSRTISLQPDLGAIRFVLSPADAELLIDGQSVGQGSQTLSLPAHEHRVEVRKAGYASQREKVTPRPGLEQQLAISLLSEAEARKAAMKPEVISSLGQTLRLIDPLGEPRNAFSMGTSRREPGRRSNEVLHPVTLERAFYLATHETTNAQFRQFLASHDSGQIEGKSLNREHQPVVRVSWQQAASFCNWLSAREGLPPFYRESQGIITGYNTSSTGYRLPTEAEWAFAARIQGDNTLRFAWGDAWPPTTPVTNVADNSSAYVTGRILNGYEDGYIVSAPVGSFPANPRGLFDIGGNVAEWVHDVYQIPSPNSDVEVDPLGAQNGDNYTVRGGSWSLSRLSELRLTYRDYGQSGRDDLGFRIARYAQ